MEIVDLKHNIHVESIFVIEFKDLSSKTFAACELIFS